ncbi:hypothetical protein [Allobaculum stercoricanis]|uniref:hypothetical protein n=1 Tax=Allobaculum stercoricanis TaxID=174709 RepID=UPI002943397B|nr:hypothetical protein [Allobaculum stercoricanis]
MKKSKYESRFSELKELICDVNENELKDQVERGTVISTALSWRNAIEKKISEIEMITEKLERENIGLKQTNLNQKEKLEKYFNGIK